VPRLVFLDSARRDLAEIAAFIERESMDRARADDFIDKIIAHCQKLASRTAAMGRARPELRAAYRSATFGNYVIFLTYASEGTGPRDVMKIVHVLWGARDLDAYFRNYTEPEDNSGTGN
jgi:toxin ParE1/3/4